MQTAVWSFYNIVDCSKPDKIIQYNKEPLWKYSVC